jgi:hypothetical protein
MKHAPITCTVAWKEVKEGEEVRKRTYSGDECSIVECRFPVNVKCFVKCICMQRIKFS